jgi:hypothetical protein
MSKIFAQSERSALEFYQKFGLKPKKPQKLGWGSELSNFEFGAQHASYSVAAVFRNIK